MEEGMRGTGGFWDTGHVLFLDLGADYTGVFIVGIHQAVHS